uniref:Uncharacterized protein n=1 Tax=Heterorhabditis bacteriophora TaxID=37862 RepID=A0A1I7WIJ0_HETBA
MVSRKPSATEVKIAGQVTPVHKRWWVRTTIRSTLAVLYTFHVPYLTLVYARKRHEDSSILGGNCCEATHRTRLATSRKQKWRTPQWHYDGPDPAPLLPFPVTYTTRPSQFLSGPIEKQ